MYSKNTIKIEHEGVDVDLCSDFGYVLYLNEIFSSWKMFTDRTISTAQWLAVQICAHEVRHEMQFIHKINRQELRKTFPAYDAIPGIQIDWQKFAEDSGKFYGEIYAGKKRSQIYLARELDSIITSYMAVHAWFSEEFKNDKERFQEISRIIRSS